MRHGALSVERGFVARLKELYRLEVDQDSLRDRVERRSVAHSSAHHRLNATPGLRSEIQIVVSKEIMQGQLIIWSAERGFGFIQPDATTDISDRLFVHKSNFALADLHNVRLGARVTFSIGDPISIGKKPQAINAKVILPNGTTAGISALQEGAQ